MKKWYVIYISMMLVVFIVSACSKEWSKSLPEPPVDLHVALSVFNTVRYDNDDELGTENYRYLVHLSKAQKEEFLQLLQTDSWITPQNFEPRGYATVINAVGDQGWNLTVGYWDETQTLIALSNIEQNVKMFYFAPFEVQQDIKVFRDGLDA